MIGIILSFGTEIVEVRISGHNIYFRKVGSQGWARIENIKLSQAGVIREHPDLKDNEQWHEIAIERLKQKLIELETEEARFEYVVKELKGVGYVPMYKQKQGHRPVKL